MRARSPSLESVVVALSADSDAMRLLADKRIGLEKESLRVDRQGRLVQTPHPAALGTALTHPYITTDFSEAQLELITPKMRQNTDALKFLTDLHTYIYRHLSEEILWANSMPCVLKNGEKIPIAQYGRSNLGQMKHIYRQGLKLRYGSAMQTISGVHFNYSVHADLWSVLQTALQTDAPLSALRQLRYMGMVRNLLRLGWMIPYLFGTSPVVCKNFIGGNVGRMQAFDEATLFEPYATSLRMGSVGYQNNEEIKTGLSVSYNSLEAYLASLRDAVSTRHPPYQALGIRENGVYRQLSANILQIENEYYATVRPKRIAGKDEMSLLALHRSGIDYVELRSLDVNVFADIGITPAQLNFLETLFLFCLLTDSPPLSSGEQHQASHNEITAAHEGRKPGLCLQQPGGSASLADWGQAVCQELVPVAEMLDDANGGNDYQQALHLHQMMFIDPEQTLSARMLAEMRERGENFVTFVLRKSYQYRTRFLSHRLSNEQIEEWDILANTSLSQQRQIEESDKHTLDAYIHQHFSQLNELDQLP